MPTNPQEELRQLLEMRALQHLLRQLFQETLAAQNAPSTLEFAKQLKLERGRLHRFVFHGRPFAFNAKMQSEIDAIDQIAAFVQRALKNSSLDPSDRELLSRAGEIFHTSTLSDRLCSITIFPEFALTLAYELRMTKLLLLEAEPNWIFARAFGPNAELVEGLLDLRSEALQQLIVNDRTGNEQPSKLAIELAARVGQTDEYNKLEADVHAQYASVQAEFERLAVAYEQLLEAILGSGIRLVALYDALKMSRTNHTNIVARNHRRISVEALHKLLRKLMEIARTRGLVVGASVREVIASIPAEAPSADSVSEQSDESQEIAESASTSDEAPPLEGLATVEPPSHRSESERLLGEIRSLWESHIQPRFQAPEQASAALAIDQRDLRSALRDTSPAVPRDRLRTIARAFRQYALETSSPMTEKPTPAHVHASEMPSGAMAPLPEANAAALLGELLLRVHRGELPSDLLRLGPEQTPPSVDQHAPMIGDLDVITEHCLGMLESTLRLLRHRIEAEPLTHRATKLELLRLLFSLMKAVNPERELLEEARRGSRFATSFDELFTTHPRPR